MDMKRMGNKISILCPAHNDKHFGNCYLTEKGFYCYACDEKGDVLNLVSLYCGISLFEAFKLIANYYGGIKHFVLSADQRKRNSSIEEKCRIIPKPEVLEFLGLHCKNKYARNGIYSVKKILGEFEQYTPERNEYVELFPSDEESEGYKVVLSCIQKNPLQELALSSPEIFKELIKDKAQETYEKYLSMIDAVKTCRIHNMFDYYCNQVAKEVGVPVFVHTCELLAEKAKSIYIKYGGNPTINKRNIFGDVKLEVAL